MFKNIHRFLASLTRAALSWLLFNHFHLDVTNPKCRLRSIYILDLQYELTLWLTTTLTGTSQPTHYPEMWWHTSSCSVVDWHKSSSPGKCYKGCRSMCYWARQHDVRILNFFTLWLRAPAGSNQTPKTGIQGFPALGSKNMVPKILWFLRISFVQSVCWCIQKENYSYSVPITP